MKEFQSLKAKTLKTQQLVEKAGKTLEHYIDRRDGADGDAAAEKLEDAKSKFLRVEESYYEDYDTAQKQLLDHKPALEEVMRYMEGYEQERITHLKEILDNLMDERVNNANGISKALAGVKKLIDCVNVQMDMNNFLSQVKYPEPFNTINTRSPIIQSVISGNTPARSANEINNRNALAMMMAINDLRNNNTDPSTTTTGTAGNNYISSAASIRIDPHLLGLLSTNGNNTNQLQLQQAFQQANNNNNNNNNGYRSLPSTDSFDTISCGSFNSFTNNNNDMEVLYNYESTQSGVLSVKAGDIIKNVTAVNDEWISGEINGNKGMLPKTFVKPISMNNSISSNQIVSSSFDDSNYPLSCVAVYDCISDDSKVLNFSKGERLYYRNSSTVQSGWLEGRNDRGECGLIPESYINKL